MDGGFFSEFDEKRDSGREFIEFEEFGEFEEKIGAGLTRTL